MRAMLIFDHLNDVLFVKCDKRFACHILKLAKTQGLLDDKVRIINRNNKSVPVINCESGSRMDI